MSKELWIGLAAKRPNLRRASTMFYSETIAEAIIMLTQELVRKLFRYEDGELIRLSNGKRSGSMNSRGYLNVYANKCLYVAHRIIFIYHHGYLPKFIDHIDGDRLNNKIENLRPATKADNSRNMKITQRNTSGAKGVYWHSQRSKWQGRVVFNYKTISVGLYEKFEDAKKAVCKKRAELHGEFANNG